MRKELHAKTNISPEIVCTAAWRLAKAEPLEDYRLEVEFLDGTHGLVEMKQRIMSKNAGVFAKLRDPDVFAQVELVYGVVTWCDEIDLAPDAMYAAIQSHGKWVLT